MIFLPFFITVSVHFPCGELQTPYLQHSVHLPPMGRSAWLDIGPFLTALYPGHRSLQTTALQRIFSGGQYAWVQACTLTHSLVHALLFVINRNVSLDTAHAHLSVICSVDFIIAH